MIPVFALQSTSGGTAPTSAWDRLFSPADWTSTEITTIAVPVLIAIVTLLWPDFRNVVIKGLGYPFRKRGLPVLPIGEAPEHEVQGRESDLETLAQSLNSGGNIVLIPKDAERPGGVGKSTLARLYLERQGPSYGGGCAWILAESPQTIERSLSELSTRLDLKPASDATDRDRALAAIGHILDNGERWLLVFDNATDPEHITKWLPSNKNVSVVVTSRHVDWPVALFKTQSVSVLPSEAKDSAAVTLLMQEAGGCERRSDGPEAALFLAQLLQGLPKSLVTIGAVLRRDSKLGFTECLDRIGAELAHLPKQDYAKPSFVPDAERAATIIALQDLKADPAGEDAALLLKVFARLAPEGLAEELITALRGKSKSAERFRPIPRRLWQLSTWWRRGALRRAFQALEQRRLLERDGEHWKIHRNTQSVQRSLLDDDVAVPGTGEELPSADRADVEAKNEYNTADPTNWRAVAAALLAASYPGGANSPEHRENWPTCAWLDPHVAALADNDPPATAAMDYLLNQASVYLDAQRMDDRALRYSEESLRLKEARLGLDHETVGTACNNLAGQYWRLGRMAEAEAMAARTIEIEKGHPKVTEASFAISLSTHGLMAEDVGRSLTGAAQREKLDLAEQRCQQALEIDERLHGRQSRQVATRLNNLAELHGWQGKWDQAITGQAEMNAIHHVVLTAGDPQLAAGMHNLAAGLLNCGRARQGHEDLGVLNLLEEALAIREDAFDRVDHPDRVSTASRLASAHWALLEIGPPITGTVQPNADRAVALCATYGLDLDFQKAHAADYALRGRMHEEGLVIPGDMQMQNERAERIAEKLAGDWDPRAAYETLTGTLAPKDLTDAYRVQEVLQRKFEATRGPIAGRKIALSSKTMQEMVGIDQPIAGAIFANDIHRTGGEISLSTFRHLGLEYELAFELARDISERVEAGSVLDLVAGVRPAFELIEDRDAGYSELDVLTLVADNAWCGGVVLGDPIEGWRDLELGDLPSVLSQEGVVDEAGNTGAADPVNSLAWVLNHFVGRGAKLKAGEMIITGSVLKTRFPVPGDRVRYEIAGHAAVEVSLVA